MDLWESLQDSWIDYSYNIGGRYSGKTYGILQIMVLIAVQFQGYRWAVFRKVAASLRDTVFDELVGICQTMLGDPGGMWRFTVSPMRITIGKSVFLFKGMDSTEKTKGLARCHGAFLEELNEFTEMDFETIDNGIRGTEFPHIVFMAHNPIPTLPGDLYWFQKMFGEMMPKRGKLAVNDTEYMGRVAKTKTSFLDNFFCPEKRRLRLEGYKKSNPGLYKLWSLGDYTELKGVILKNWDVVESVPDGIDELGHGLDFGFSNDPAACVKAWANSTDLWVKGILYSTDLTNSQLYDKMVSGGVGENDLIVADSAEPKSIEDLYSMGFYYIMGANKKANYKTEMAQILQGYNIHLIAGDTDLQREFQTWSWAEDKNGKLLPKPKDGNDHYIDALVMLCHETLGASDAVYMGSA